METIFTNDYYALRDLVKPGDMIAVYNDSLFGKGIKLVTGDGRTHVGNIVFAGDRVLLAEMDGIKNVIIPLSQYTDKKMEVYRAPIDVADDKKNDLIWDMLGVHTKYSYTNIFQLLVIKLISLLYPKFKYRPRTTKSSSMICTEFSVVYFDQLGWDHSIDTKVIYPANLCDALGDPVAIYTPTK